MLFSTSLQKFAYSAAENNCTSALGNAPLKNIGSHWNGGGEQREKGTPLRHVMLGLWQC
jgi:hypothetical protein